MLRMRRSWKLRLAMVFVALLGAWIGLAQAPRQVNDAALKERWRAPGGGAGPFAGGSLSTAGNLVFSSVNNRLLAFRADTGEKIFDLDLGTSQMGPPISFALDGKQYIAVAGGPAVGGGRGGGGGAGAGAAAVAPRPANLLVLALDGNAPLPWAPANPQQ